MKKFDSEEARRRLTELPQWRFDEQRGAITREFRFADFAQAFAFMTRIALAAERRNHHPEWSNVYNRVTVTWSTHDADGLTQLDLDSARECERAYEEPPR